MRIVLAGAGEVGSYVAERLSRQGHDVAVVERDPERLRRIEDDLDVLVVEGSATDPSALERAGVAKADLLVAVTNADEVNLIACLLARQAGVARTVARAEHFDLASPETRRLQRAVEVDLLIDPDAETAREILALLSLRGAQEIAQMAGGEVEVVGARLAAGAPAVGRTLAEIAAAYEPHWDFLFGTVTREGRTTVPRGDFRLAAQDLVRVVCTPRARPELARLLGLQRTSVRRAVLLGGGRTAAFLAHALARRGSRVQLVEQDRARAEELARLLPREVLVLRGDITDADLLDEEEVGAADAVVALTGDDGANVLAAMYARAAGAREAIVMAHQLELLPLLERVGVDAAVSSRTACANAVLRFVRGGVSAVATSLAGEAEVVELAVAEGSRADGARVADLDLPLDVLIGAVVRDGNAQIARGRTVLRGRDRIIVFAMPASVQAVHDLVG